MSESNTIHTAQRLRKRANLQRSSTLYGTIIYSLLAGYSTCHAWTASQSTRSDGLPPSAASPTRGHSLTPLATTFDDLSSQLGGSGKAKACWECFRSGIDPVFVFEKGDDSSPSFLGEREEDGGILMGWTRQQITEHLTGTAKRGTPLTLGHTTLQLLSDRTSPNLESCIAQLSKLTTAKDGTTKLLLKLRDGFEVEAVIIPWHDRQTSTLCVSSQVGCRQACTFCSTGRMGKLRDLTADEILIQLFWALKICRLSSTTSQNQKLFPIQNIVFMGMGEPADNVEAVNLAARIMVDRRQFQLPASKVVISTVAPSPSSFKELLLGGGNSESKYDATEFTLAWSLHSSRNDVRQRLVPTARYTVAELRDGLIDAIQSRTSRRFRSVMIEITLIDGMNDSVDDARHLAEFCGTIHQRVPGLKLVVNLIPWNDIDASVGPASAYRKPTMERVSNFQKALTQDKNNKILCYVRTTRGDEDNAACGMLATKSKEGKVAR